MKLFRFLLGATFAITLSAQTTSTTAPPSTDDRLAALDSDLHTLARVVDVAKDVDQNRQVMQAITDNQIEVLREKRADGSYRWARLQREEDGRETEEKAVEKVNTEAQLQTVTVSAARAYRLEISVPRKRGLVSENNRVFVRNASVDWTTLDGKSVHTDLPINVWVSPGDAHSVALPDIARSAKATVEFGVESGNKKALAKASLIQAKLVDDPQNPNYPAVTRLLNIKRLIGEEHIRRADLKSALDEAILSLPGELERRNAAQAESARLMREAAAAGTMKGSIALGDATPDVVDELNAIARLSAGSLDDQNEARTRLRTLIETLSPAPKPAM